MGEALRRGQAFISSRATKGAPGTTGQQTPSARLRMTGSSESGVTVGPRAIHQPLTCPAGDRGRLHVQPIRPQGDIMNNTTRLRPHRALTSFPFFAGSARRAWAFAQSVPMVQPGALGAIAAAVLSAEEATKLCRGALAMPPLRDPSPSCQHMTQFPPQPGGGDGGAGECEPHQLPRKFVAHRGPDRIEPGGRNRLHEGMAGRARRAVVRPPLNEGVTAAHMHHMMGRHGGRPKT